MPVALIPAAIGAYQAISGGIRANKARKALANQKTPIYAPDKSILDYYSQAANRANVSPYNSQAYQNTKVNAGNTLSYGLNALQDRRSALGGISALTQNYNNNVARGGVAAENQQNQRFGQLGNAARMENSEYRNVFQNNSMLPYQNQRGIYAAEAAGGNQEFNAGISNLSGGLQNAARLSYANKQYKQNGYDPNDALG